MAATLHPAWKQALVDFKNEGFTEGSVLTFDWLYDRFQIRRPTATSTYEQSKDAELQFLDAFKKFEQHLLTEQLVALRNVRGVGYQVVPTREQTRWAFREGMRDVSQGIRKMTQRLVHIDDAKLTAAERKENDDAQARVGALQMMMARTRRLPRPA